LTLKAGSIQIHISLRYAALDAMDPPASFTRNAVEDELLKLCYKFPSRGKPGKNDEMMAADGKNKLD
jgi:hypothetical protein